MSKINELVEKLCPNGAEYYSIRDLCNITRGRVMSKDYIRDNRGEYPVYSSQTENNGELGKISTYDYEGEYLTWTTDGANAGSVFYRDGKFSVTNVCGLLKVINNRITTKFLYYILSIEAPKYVNAGMGNPKLMSNVMARIKVVVPPLEVQHEIVHILDDFTLLSAELSAELKARQKQYKYYRNKLFSDIQNESKIMKVEDISLKISSGGTPLTTNQEYYNGNIPWLRTQEVNFDEIYDTGVKITKDAIKNSSAKLIPKNCVIVAMYGATVGKVGINKIEMTTNQACCNIEVNPNIVEYKYLFYWLSEQYSYIKSLGQGSQTNINSKIVKELKVPIPSLEKQRKIVSILDKFKKITQDFTEGIPAEIDYREKQYNYYRDRLLNFKREGDVE